VNRYRRDELAAARADAAVLALEIGSYLAAGTYADGIDYGNVARSAVTVRDWLLAAPDAPVLAARTVAARQHLANLRQADRLPSALGPDRFITAAAVYERVLTRWGTAS
jgi:hypothetical protein